MMMVPIRLRVLQLLSAMLCLATLMATAQMPARLGLPELSINDVTLDESACASPNFVFTVTLSHLSRQPVTVNYATSDGSPGGGATAALAGKEYVPIAGALIFDYSTPPN